MKFGPGVGLFFHDPGPNSAMKFGPAGTIFARVQIKSDTGTRLIVGSKYISENYSKEIMITLKDKQ